MIQRYMYTNKKIGSDCSIVFDLDDTIFYEKNYVMSGFNEIDQYLRSQYGIKNAAQTLKKYFFEGAKDPIEKFCQELNLNIKQQLICLMRESIPSIKARPGIIQLLKKLKSKNYEIGIITNGRSLTQRKKIEALNIQYFIDILLISEEIGFAKPELEIFKEYMLQSRKKKFLFIGNNPVIDINPTKELKWKTIYCVSNNSMLKNYGTVDADWYVGNFYKNTINKIFIDKIK